MDHFGPTKISIYLKRYHDVEISTSAVWRILTRLCLNRCSRGIFARLQEHNPPIRHHSLHEGDPADVCARRKGISTD